MFCARGLRLPRQIVSGIIITTFIFTSIIPTSYAQTVPQSVLNLPVPGTMITPTTEFAPPLIKGITVFPDNPLKFQFIIDRGDNYIEGQELVTISKRMIKYFLATVTTPEDQLWVNLSPYEQERIIPEALGQTELGRDMLAQDYLLKQLTASLMYPEDELGKEFWQRVRTKAMNLYGTAEIPMNTFNKIWIVPEQGEILEHETSAFVLKRHLKVMLEEDMLALQKNLDKENFGTDEVVKDDVKVMSGVTADVVRNVLIPEIEKEVNYGQTFAPLRQIYDAMLLATWYKMNLKESLLGQVYMNQNKISGVDVEDKAIKQKIYDQYIAAFKKGVYDYIKEDFDPVTQDLIPRKYFSGGLQPWRSANVPAGATVGFRQGQLTVLGLGDVEPSRFLAALGDDPSRFVLADIAVIESNADNLATIDEHEVALALRKMVVKLFTDIYPELKDEIESIQDEVDFNGGSRLLDGNVIPVFLGNLRAVPGAAPKINAARDRLFEATGKTNEFEAITTRAIELFDLTEIIPEGQEGSLAQLRRWILAEFPEDKFDGITAELDNQLAELALGGTEEITIDHVAAVVDNLAAELPDVMTEVEALMEGEEGALKIDDIARSIIDKYKPRTDTTGPSLAELVDAVMQKPIHRKLIGLIVDQLPNVQGLIPQLIVILAFAEETNTGYEGEEITQQHVNQIVAALRGTPVGRKAVLSFSSINQGDVETSNVETVLFERVDQDFEADTAIIRKAVLDIDSRLRLGPIYSELMDIFLTNLPSIEPGLEMQLIALIAFDNSPLDQAEEINTQLVAHYLTHLVNTIVGLTVFDEFYAAHRDDLSDEYNFNDIAELLLKLYEPKKLKAQLVKAIDINFVGFNFEFLIEAIVDDMNLEAPLTNLDVLTALVALSKQDERFKDAVYERAVIREDAEATEISRKFDELAREIAGGSGLEIVEAGTGDAGGLIGRYKLIRTIDVNGKPITNALIERFPKAGVVEPEFLSRTGDVKQDDVPLERRDLYESEQDKVTKLFEKIQKRNKGLVGQQTILESTIKGVLKGLRDQEGYDYSNADIDQAIENVDLNDMFFNADQQLLVRNAYTEFYRIGGSGQLNGISALREDIFKRATLFQLYEGMLHEMLEAQLNFESLQDIKDPKHVIIRKIQEALSGQGFFGDKSEPTLRELITTVFNEDKAALWYRLKIKQNDIQALIDIREEGVGLSPETIMERFVNVTSTDQAIEILDWLSSYDRELDFIDALKGIHKVKIGPDEYEYRFASLQPMLTPDTRVQNITFSEDGAIFEALRGYGKTSDVSLGDLAQMPFGGSGFNNIPKLGEKRSLELRTKMYQAGLRTFADDVPILRLEDQLRLISERLYLPNTKQDRSLMDILIDSMDLTDFLNDIAESAGIKKDAAIAAMVKAGIAEQDDEASDGYTLIAKELYNSKKLSRLVSELKKASSNPKAVDLTVVRMERIINNSVNIKLLFNNIGDRVGLRDGDVVRIVERLEVWNVFTRGWKKAKRKEYQVGKIENLKINYGDKVSDAYVAAGVGIEFSIPKAMAVNIDEQEEVEGYQRAVINDDLKLGGHNYRGGKNVMYDVITFFKEVFEPEYAQKIADFINEQFDNGKGLEAIITNGIGANDQFMWALVEMYNRIRPEGAPKWIHVTTARDLVRAESFDPETTLSIHISRSGGTWEGVEVANRLINRGFKKMIVVANGGKLLDLGNVFPESTIQVEMQPDIGGRNMHRKTPIYYTAMAVAGMFAPEMKPEVFAQFHHEFDQANAFDQDDSPAVNAAKFLHLLMETQDVEHVAFLSNFKQGEIIGSEISQYFMEGANKQHVISFAQHDLLSEAPVVLDNLSKGPAAQKTMIFALLDKASSGYKAEKARIDWLKDKMAVQVYEIDSRDSGLPNSSISPKQQAAFDIFSTDFITALTAFLRVDANSNPNVKVVREMTADYTAKWEDIDDGYESDPIGSGRTPLMVSLGQPGDETIGTRFKRINIDDDITAQQEGIRFAKQLVRNGDVDGRSRLNFFGGMDGQEHLRLMDQLRQYAYESGLSKEHGWIMDTGIYPFRAHKGHEATLAYRTPEEIKAGYAPLLANQTISMFFHPRNLGDNEFYNDQFEDRTPKQKDAGVNGATIHQINDAMTIPNIQRAAQVAPSFLFEYQTINQEIIDLIRAFQKAFIDTLVDEIAIHNEVQSIYKPVQNKEALEKVADEFTDEMERARAKGVPSSVSDLPSWITSAPDDLEGDYVGIDWGGEKGRALHVRFKKGQKPEIIKVVEKEFGEELRNSDTRQLMKFVSTLIKGLGLDEGIQYSLGLTFSFPLIQNSIGEAILEKWTKEWNAEGFVGEELSKIFQEGIEANGIKNIKLRAIINDTVGTQLTVPGAVIGLIFGTGFNFSFFDPETGQIINTEAAGFDRLQFTKEDLEIFFNREQYSEHALEKMASGPYIHDILRLKLLTLWENGHFLKGSDGAILKNTELFSAELVSDIDGARSYANVREILTKAGLDEISFEEDVEAVRELVRVISMRAGRLIAASLVAALRKMDPDMNQLKTIAVDGSVYKLHPNMRHYIDKAIISLIGAQKAANIQFVLTEEGSGVGAAIAAAMAERNESDPDGGKGQPDRGGSPTAAAIVADDRDRRQEGGINLNPALFDLKIRRDKDFVPLPMDQQPVNLDVDGFTPMILNISPIPSIPMLLGIADPTQEEPIQVGWTKEDYFEHRLKRVDIVEGEEGTLL